MNNANEKVSVPDVLALPMFLGLERTRQLREDIETAVHARADCYCRTWCPATQFAVVVAISKGRPFHWVTRGPLTVEQAALFFRTECPEVERAASRDKRH